MDLYKNGEIFVNAKFSSINSLKDYDCKYLVSGIHSFKDDSDVTGLYELQYERVKANTGGWFKCNEHEYKSEWECDRRIVAIPTTPPIEPVGMEGEGNELLGKFKYFEVDIFHKDLEGDHAIASGLMTHQSAKQCAIIHCELMIKRLPSELMHYTKLIEKIKQL